MSWAWAAPLGLAALAAGIFTALAGAMKREVARLQLARAEVRHARPGVGRAAHRRQG